jgi:hypothetical protein
MKPSTGAAVRNHRIAVRLALESLSAFTGISTWAYPVAPILKNVA